MTSQYRLLTFDSLPLPLFNADESPLRLVLQRLTASSVYYENHYLQTPGIQSISGKDHRSLLNLHDQFRADKTETLVVVDCPDDDGFREQLPDVIPRRQISGFDALRSSLKELSSSEFVWIHCQCPKENLKDEAAQAAYIESAFECCRTEESSDRLLITTSISGLEASLTPFESQLFDGSVHVPLWITGNSLSTNRVQTVTGSHDILYTVCSSVDDEQTENTAPQNLVRLAQQPVSGADRTIQISWREQLAIRTKDFFFVRPTSVANDEGLAMDRDVALYAKPEDVWNLHDVSAEYHEIVQHLSALCPDS